MFFTKSDLAHVRPSVLHAFERLVACERGARIMFNATGLWLA